MGEGQDQEGRVDQQGYLKINHELLEILSQINWNFSINHLFIFIVQSSGRTGGGTRLLSGFTFINIDRFLSLE